MHLPNAAARLSIAAILLATGPSGLAAGCSADALRPRPPAGALRPNDWIAAPFANWPLLPDGVESRSFSSFDRKGGNADGFDGRYATLYLRPSGEHVIFDALGPGVLRTLWFTGPDEGGAGLDLGRLRFYFDDEPAPRLALTVRELFCGTHALFTPPLVSHNGQSSGAFVSWIPLPFARRLVITTANEPRFYAAYYDRLPPGTSLSSFDPAAPKMAAALRARLVSGLQPTTSLRAVPLHYSRRGAGTIERLRFTPARRPSAAELARARITIKWDGEQRAGIDLPLDLFFGSGLGEARIDSLAFVQRLAGAYENRFPMPFWRGFELRVEGLPGQLELAIGARRFSRLHAGHLRAQWMRNDYPRAGADVLWLDASGAGKLVATVLAIVPPDPATKRWWEGDLRSYVDGRRTPGIHGTGLEDDHLGGWSNTFFTHPFSLPLHGEPVSVLLEQQELQHNARISLYRLWPGVPFYGHLRHGLEHGSENTVQVAYRGATFYYAHAARGATLVEADRLDLGDARSRRTHELTIEGSADGYLLDSAFEGEGYLEPLVQRIVSHRGEARFVLALRPKNRGCWLRRLYDQSSGRQRARVLVDQRYLTDWYSAATNDVLRWAERDVFLPARVTQGKRRIALTIIPRRDAAPWTAAEYRLLCLQR